VDGLMMTPIDANKIMNEMIPTTSNSHRPSKDVKEMKPSLKISTSPGGKKTSNAGLTVQEMQYWEERQMKSPNTPHSVSDSPGTGQVEDKKLETWIQAYHQVKIFSIKVSDCCDRLSEINQEGRISLLQEFVSHFRLARDSLCKFIDSTISISNTLELRRNGVDLLRFEILMTTEFLLGNGQSPNAQEFRKLFQTLNVNIDSVMRKYQPASKVKCVNIDDGKECCWT
jgi:hypothetical protein